MNTQGSWCPGLASQGTQDGHHGDGPPVARSQLAHVTVYHSSFMTEDALSVPVSRMREVACVPPGVTRSRMV